MSSIPLKGLNTAVSPVVTQWWCVVTPETTMFLGSKLYCVPTLACLCLLFVYHLLISYICHFGCISEISHGLYLSHDLHPNKWCLWCLHPYLSVLLVDCGSKKKTATSWAPQGATGSKLRSALCHPEAPRRVRFRWHFASRSPQAGLYETDLSITLVSKSSVCSFYDSLTSFHNLPSVSSLSALAFTGISSISQFPPGQIHWIFPRR